ncbi:TetR/AcrR family transcriptional regulator [Nocardia sp. NPDC058633]|uniref:TetR/AcrR family transcriptional regulator n=1 Tax=Nocardia sp. NPDC058633 TaxID=3346568 RepID=UPI0036584951
MEQAANTDSEGALPSMARTSLLRDLPTTQRGLRTRDSLIAAGRKVFERMGYLDTRLIDITQEASCSSGTFYTYFASKEEIFAAILEHAQEDMMHPGMPHVTGEDNPASIIEAANLAYFEAYKRNAKLMGLLEQVAHIDPEFSKLRQNRGDAFIARNARGIADLQRRGLADPDLDPVLTSRALSGMVSRMAFNYFVIGDGQLDGKPVPMEEVVHTLSRLWANALRMPTRS